MKKILLFIYDSFAEFEIVLFTTALNQEEFQLVTFSTKPAGETVTGVSSMSYVPTLTIDDIDVNEFEALVIPGGTTHPLLTHQPLHAIIRAFYDQNKTIAAICGGPALLGAAGILQEITFTASLTPDDHEYNDVMTWDNKLEQMLVVDRQVITATGSNYVQFAEEVLRRIGSVPEDEQNPLQYFREPSMN
ncbi:DJ-1/PfpI family protein [Brevibacillus choshinensis]|uniref:DJ-1/PfpI family protein n=1 Tax=Brevibacillus choshinensis TaxID=54911 RepID=UPI002E1E24A7|nr:DJ-1/PfpI family protein [Brevibacillus choshinensis]